MPPKNKIKIVDVVDKDAEKDDNYAVTVDAVKEGELSDKNEQPEKTEEIRTTDEKTDEKLKTIKESKEEQTSNTSSTDPTKQIREQNLIKCTKCGKFVTEKTMKYTHSLKCGEVKKSRPKKADIIINENVQEDKPDPTPIQKVVKDKPQPVLQQHTKAPVVK